MTVLSIVAITLLLCLFYSFVYTVYSSCNPQVVKIDDSYYVRKWSMFFWSYLSSTNTLWWNWEYANGWSRHDTLEQCLRTLKRVKPPKVQKIKIN